MELYGTLARWLASVDVSTASRGSELPAPQLVSEPSPAVQLYPGIGLPLNMQSNEEGLRCDEELGRETPEVTIIAALYNDPTDF